MPHFASNAVLAKAHAMYGRRLHARQYQDLLGCSSVGEVAAYLKSHTPYADMLEGVTTQFLHRAQIETLLRQRLLGQYAALSRYDHSVGKNLYRYFIMRGEVEQILSCIRLLGSENPEDYLLTMPAFFSQHAQIDLFLLAKSATLQDVLRALQGSPYEQSVRRFAAGRQNATDFLLLESELERSIYTTALSIIHKQFRGKRQKEIMDLLQLRLDIRLLTHTYRLKNLLRADAAQIRSLVYCEHSRLPPHKLEALLEAQDGHTFLQLLEDTPYATQFSKNRSIFIEDWARRKEYSCLLHAFRYSTNPGVVMFAYLFLAENESNNIKQIIQGVKYNVPAQRISDVLVGTEIPS